MKKKLELVLLFCFILSLTIDAQTFVKGFSGNSASDFTNVNGTLFFWVNDGVNGKELWKSDGTTIGTTLVSDITPGAAGSSFTQKQFTVLNNELFFSISNNSTYGIELWKSDGTALGTGILKDINPGASSSNPGNGYSTGMNYLINSNNNLFFRATDGSSGDELWKTDGTSNGTILVKDIYPGTIGSSPDFLCDVNGTVFFSAYSSATGTELWKSDGTAVGTVLVKDINSGSTSSIPQFLTNVNGTLFFFANDGVSGRELWRSDGTSVGTVLVKDINPGSTTSEPVGLGWNDWMINGNGTLYFYANEITTGRELWKSDGTTVGTVLVKDINSGSASSVGTGSYAPWMRYSNGELYFQASNGINGQELWKSDGTTSGTVMVKDINTGSGNSSPRYLAIINNICYFVATQSSQSQLCKSDGTLAETTTITISPSDPYPSELTNVNGILFFRAFTMMPGEGLWKLDTNATTFIDDAPFETKFLKIFPNPTNGNFTIDSEKELEITITNILGKTILTHQIQQGKNQINLSNQPNGIYFIKNEDSTLKIIKE
jgi:ELWxxDGT repeat protein